MHKETIYNYSAQKNESLIEQRGISFDDIIFYIKEGCLLDIIEHPNKDKYPNQQMYVVKVDRYIYIVPFIIEEGGKSIFLKTIFPSRKATKHYLNEGN